MDPISALIGGGASLLGGLLNSSSASALNKANLAFANQQLAEQKNEFNQSMAFQTNQATGVNLHGYLPNLVQASKEAGLSPLAALGVQNNASAPAVIGGVTPNTSPTNPGEGLESAGRILSQMKLNNNPSPLDNLQAKLIQAQIGQVTAETIGQSIRNSHMALTAQPGVKPDGSFAHPFPAHAWYGDPGERPFMGQSKELADQSFGIGGHVASATGAFKSAGETALQGLHAIGDDVSHLYQSVRPDWLRFFSMTQGQ